MTIRRRLEKIDIEVTPGRTGLLAVFSRKRYSKYVQMVAEPPANSVCYVSTDSVAHLTGISK